uniref:Uncharacterized protein n=1 Tax=Plectus sambesii TaxID=2011161 RepID=A0A914UIS2_9BILA
MLLFLCVTLVTLSNSLSLGTATEIPGKTVTLASDRSSVEFDSIEWDPKKKLTVALRLATHSTEGQLMTLKGEMQNADETVFELSLEIKQRALNVYLYDGSRAVIAQSENVKNDIATGEEISLVLDLNLDENALGITLGKSTQARIPIEKQIPTDQKMDVIINLGAVGDESSVSIVGCVTLVSVYLDVPLTFTVKTQSKDVVDDCKNPCDGFECNGGACINEYSRAVCDCFTTGRHGAQCQTASLPVAVTSENFIRYRLDENERQPERIAFAFRVGKNVDEGLLLHAAVTSEKNQFTGILSMELINNDNVEDSINFHIGDLISMDFPDFPKGDEIFHDVVITFFYEMRKVQVIIDGEEKTATLEMEDTTDRLIFSDAIYFGGSADEGANGIGLFGCLKEPYVGRVALITHLNNDDENSKVTSNGPLSSCDEAAVNAVAGEEPSESTTEKVAFEEEDNSVKNEPTSTDEGKDYDSLTSTTTDGDEEEDDDENDDNKDEEPTAEKKKPAEADFDFLGLFALTEDSGTEQPPLVTCQPRDQMKCQNGGTCMKNPEGKLSCACDSGFIGLYCQFSDLPRSCQEAYDLGERAPGVYQIDVDGNGPLRDTYVLCEDGVSTVTHNMPNDTIGRSHSVPDQILPLTYRLFSPDQLGLLVKRSSECVQYLRYNCSQAPLRFQEMQTWFESAALPETSIAKIGRTDNTCPCYDSNTCEYKKRCNCDANEQGADEGLMYGLQAGITKIYVLQDKGQNDGRFTVGSLQCKGDALSANAVTMRSRNVTLETATWKGKSFSFWFRTRQYSTLIASIASSSERNFKIYLKEGHLFEYHFNINDGEVDDPRTFDRVVGFVSQSPLNDSAWHRVLVQVKSNELRLSLDKQSRFYQLIGNEVLKDTTFDSPLIIGGDKTNEGGLIGCVKQLEIDEEPFDLIEAVRNADDAAYLSPDCQDSCNKGGNPCRNGAECIEDYEARSYYCVCANPWIFSGRNCEHSVNTDTEVSFHDLKKGFLGYQNFENSPLSNTMVFSFRTDQSDAMLVYAHDEKYNFVQVHLWEENKVSLTLNNDRTVQRCTITAEPGKEFSNMDWNQVLIVYGEKHTSLYVDRLMCIIDGAHTLSSSYITSFTEGLDLLTVYPPVLPVAPSGGLEPYTLLYVGGVPQPKGRNFRRLKRQVSTRAIYNTDYPPILGCMRGFSVGNAKVDLQYGGIRPDDRYAVRLGCKTNCDTLTCQNSGHCTVDWQNLDPSTMNVASCDCSKTSYFGSTCSEDNGLTFEGQAAFVFDMVPILKRFVLPTNRKGDSFHFAFAPAVDQVPKHSRYLAVVQFAQSIKLEIILNKNGSVNAGLILPPLDTQVFTFLGNYSDGYRHFIQTTFRDKSITVIVDSVKHTFNPDSYQVTLGTVEKIYLGGFETTNKTGGVKNFVGCMSNADIDYHIDARFRFTPMEYYRNTGSEFEEFTSTVPKEATLAIDQCATFKVPGALPPPQRTVHMPNWEAPFTPQKYTRPATPAADSDSSGFPWWIIIVIAVIIIIIVVLVIVLFCCIRNRTSDSTTTPTQPLYNDDDMNKPVSTNKPNVYGDLKPIKDELLPLRSEVPADPQVHHHHFHHHQAPQQQHRPPPTFGDNQVKPNLDLPAANTHLEQNKRTKELFLNNASPPAGSWGSVLSGDTYYTAHEFGSQDDLPPPPSDDELFLQPVPFDNVTPFERTSPARLSTFGDRTVPPNSPLHRPPVVPRQPKFVPPPTSPKL